MNGVRRLLGAATGASSSQPAALNLPDNSKQLPLVSPSLFSAGAGPSWPPGDSPIEVTPALVIKKEKPQPPIRRGSNESQLHSRGRSSASAASSSRKTNGNRPGSPATTPSSSPYIGPSRLSTRKSVPKVDTEVDWKPDWKRSSTLLNTRDELLISLLASEAMVESREYEILSSEEVEELKKARKDNVLRLCLCIQRSCYYRSTMFCNHASVQQPGSLPWRQRYGTLQSHWSK